MKRILWMTFYSVVLLLSLTTTVQAAERRSFYSSVRCQSMGGACIAVANDETALLVNPAALGKVRDFYATVFDPEFEFGYQFQGFYQDKPFTAPYTLEDVLASLDAKRSTYYHAKAQVFPSLVAKNFGIGLFANYLLDAEMAADGSTLSTYYRNDYALVLGFNFRLFGGRMKLGFNSKLISRIEVDNSTLNASGPMDYTTIGTEGVGLSNDVGLILTAPWKLLPTLSLVARDVGNTSFTQSHGVRLTTTNRPNMIKQDVDAAIALFPIHSNNIRSSWTVEYRGLLTSADEEDKAKLLHAGFEMNFGDVFFTRLGYNQRYWTAGFELASERFQTQIATYGEEIGTSGAPREDRRYTIKFAYRF